MTRDDAIRKAAALLRLANGGGTVAESATAAAHAQAILDRFELTRDIVEQPEETLDEFMFSGDHPEGWIDDTTVHTHWRVTLAHGIGKLHGCQAFKDRYGRKASRERWRIEIFGRRSQVETVRYLYNWLRREIDRLTEQNGRGLGLVWRREFSQGAVCEIIERLKRQRIETAEKVRMEHADNSAALIKIDAALARITNTRETVRFAEGKGYRFSSLRSTAQNNGTARQAGADAARSINLNPARVQLNGRTRLLPS